MFQMKGLVMYELCANDVHQLLFVFRNGQHNFMWGQFGMCLQLMHAARFSHSCTSSVAFCTVPIVPVKDEVHISFLQQALNAALEIEHVYK
jgi:hypothetical protein